MPIREFRYALTIALVIAALGGCAERPQQMEWSKSGASEQELRADRETCSALATNAVPVMPVVGPPSARAATLAAMQRQNDVLADCMKDKGWQLVPVAKPETN